MTEIERIKRNITFPFTSLLGQILLKKGILIHCLPRTSRSLEQGVVLLAIQGSVQSILWSVWVFSKVSGIIYVLDSILLLVHSVVVWWLISYKFAKEKVAQERFMAHGRWPNRQKISERCFLSYCRGITDFWLFIFSVIYFLVITTRCK